MEVDESVTEKNAYRAEIVKKTPARRGKKAPIWQRKKAPSYYSPVEVRGVLDRDELECLLVRFCQHAWTTEVRILGLLLLLSRLSKDRKKRQFAFSGGAARDYVSKLERSRQTFDVGTVLEPLPLLCRIGILNTVQKAVHAHACVSAQYRFEEPYRDRELRLTLRLPQKLAEKLQNATNRKERRLNRKFPYREALLLDLHKLSIPESARQQIALRLKSDDNVNASLRNTVAMIDAAEHKISVSPTGTVFTSITSCPRGIRHLLYLDSASCFEADISAAHPSLLPVILMGRRDHLRQYGESPCDLSGFDLELLKVRAFLSEGDFYQKLCLDQTDLSEREEKKKLMTMLLNFPNKKCRANALYRRVRSSFPLCLQALEDVKKKDHRNLSKQLQRFTSDVVNAALVELQRRDIPGIPLTDCIICKQDHREAVIEVLGRHFFKRTGVCAKIGGVRYERKMSEPEIDLFHWDEAAKDGLILDYDQWEMLRTLRSEALAGRRERWIPVSIVMATNARLTSVVPASVSYTRAGTDCTAPV